MSVNDVTSGDGGNVWALVTPPASGTLDLAANGSFLYAAAAGFAGDVSFGYSLCDVDADCDDATVTITVKPNHHARLAMRQFLRRRIDPETVWG